MWKASRLIKDLAELDRCWEIVTKNFEKIKEIFINLASISNFPTIAHFDFVEYAKRCKFFDALEIRSSIDILFIGVNFELVANAENPDREL